MKDVETLASSEEMELEMKAGAKRLGEILGKDYVGVVTSTQLRLGYSTLRSILTLLETHAVNE